MAISIARSIKESMNPGEAVAQSMKKSHSHSLRDRMKGIAALSEDSPQETSRGNGVWTQLIRYNPDKEEMVIKFSDGFIAVYPNISKNTLEAAIYGSRTKSYNPNRNGSLGAWLHQHPEVMKNYHEGTSEDLMGATELLEDNTYGTSKVYTEDGELLFDMTV